MGGKRKRTDEVNTPVKRHSDAKSKEGTLDNNGPNSDLNGSIKSLSQNHNLDFLRYDLSTSCGVIESVTLKQFMCHSYFEAKLGPKVNFIIGKNGSGKSAILTGVVIGLGGSANSTSRGRSVKNFIQQGKQVAEITIKLRNTGREAYKPEVYGDAIIVQRVIRSNGYNTYNIKNSKGKVVAHHKNELNTILDYLNIQVDNPISILNQDLSRQFLRTEDPKAKYKLFMKATQLEQINCNYNWAEQNRKVSKECLEAKKRLLPALQKELEESKMKYEYFQSIDGFKEKLEALNGEKAWSQVVAVEEKLKSIQIKLASLNEQKQQIDNQIADLEGTKLRKTTEHDIIESKLHDLKTELDGFKTAKIEKGKHIQNKSLESDECRKALNTIKSDMNYAKSDRESIIARINELQAWEGNKVALEKEKRLQEVKELEEKLADLDASYRTSDHHYNQLRLSTAKFSDELKVLKNDERSIQSQMNGIRQKLHTAESAKDNHQKLFGHWVPDVLQEIDRLYDKGVFRHKPKGPLGLFIKVKDPKWNLAVERCLGNLMRTFICDNNEDLKKLENILVKNIRNQPMPTLIISKFQPNIYDVSRHCVKSDVHPSVLQMLDIEDPSVANCLIDHRSIERTLLIENENDANKTMLYNPPLNCREAYDLFANHIYPSPRFKFISNRQTKIMYFKGVEHNIIAYQNELKDMNARAQEIRIKAKLMEENYTNNDRECSEAENNLMRMQNKISSIRKKLNELRSVEDPEPIYVTNLEEDLKAFNEQLEEKEKAHDKVKVKFETVQAELKTLKEDYNTFDKDFRAKLNELVPLKEKLIISKSDLNDTQKSLNHYNGLQTTAKNNIDVKENECRKTLDEIKELVSQANDKFCERPDKVRNVTEIDRELNKVKNYLEESNKMYGKQEEVMKMYLNLMKKVKAVKTDVQSLETFLKKIDELLKIRKQHYKHYRLALSTRISTHFTAFYHHQNRGVGYIKFDHENEALKITVKPNSSCDAAQDMRALSGGERSISTVAFVTSLWEVIESPFRMLDEFDVFMDMANRRLSMGVLLEFAASHPIHQFMLFTPLEMTHINATDDIRILKLKDPERNQTVLSIGPVNEDENEES